MMAASVKDYELVEMVQQVDSFVPCLGEQQVEAALVVPSLVQAELQACCGRV